MRKGIILFAFIYILPLLHIYAEEDWRAEFDSICGKTEEAMTMKSDELKNLVSRCDKLKPIIEASDHPQKKIFFKRLEKCRDFFIYMLDVKSQEKQ